jgi:hypothetical protein
MFSYFAHFVRLGAGARWQKKSKSFKICDRPGLLAGAWFVLADRVRAVGFAAQRSLPSFGVTSRDERPRLPRFCLVIQG